MDSKVYTHEIGSAMMIRTGDGGRLLAGCLPSKATCDTATVSRAKSGGVPALLERANDAIVHVLAQLASSLLFAA